MFFLIYWRVPDFGFLLTSLDHVGPFKGLQGSLSYYSYRSLEINE